MPYPPQLVILQPVMLHVDLFVVQTAAFWQSWNYELEIFTSDLESQITPLASEIGPLISQSIISTLDPAKMYTAADVSFLWGYGHLFWPLDKHSNLQLDIVPFDFYKNSRHFPFTGLLEVSHKFEIVTEGHAMN